MHKLTRNVLGSLVLLTLSPHVYSQSWLRSMFVSENNSSNPRDTPATVVFVPVERPVVHQPSSQTGRAKTPGYEDYNDLYKVMALSVGPAWNRSANSTFTLAPEITNTYTGKKGNSAFADGELFAGYQKILSPHWIGQLGFALVATSNIKLSGDVLADANPAFNNYTYSYQVNHTHLALKTKLLSELDLLNLQYFFNASLGVGLNRAHGFTTAAKIFEEVVPPFFGDHTTAAFTYTLGAGFQKTINNHWSGGIGYEFSDLGQNRLDSASCQKSSSASGISLDHLYNNAVMFNLTYVV